MRTSSTTCCVSYACSRYARTTLDESHVSVYIFRCLWVSEAPRRPDTETRDVFWRENLDEYRALGANLASSEGWIYVPAALSRTRGDSGLWGNAEGTVVQILASSKTDFAAGCAGWISGDGVIGRGRVLDSFLFPHSFFSFLFSFFFSSLFSSRGSSLSADLRRRRIEVLEGS